MQDWCVALGYGHMAKRRACAQGVRQGCSFELQAQKWSDSDKFFQCQAREEDMVPLNLTLACQFILAEL